MDERDLVHHGLAIKRHCAASAVADLVGVSIERATAVLRDAAATGRAIEIDGAYALTPLARVALEGRYSRHFGEVRSDGEFLAAYEAFERINRILKQVITDWQTMTVGGTRVANDHSDERYDAAIIDRLGGIHEQVEPTLRKLSRRVPRLWLYAEQLGTALEAAENGAVLWVSDIRRASYHTVWFELHEDLLRIMGRTREE